MFKRSKIGTGALLAMGVLVGVPVLAQTTTQRVEITGSSIKRTDSEGTAPVTIVTRKEIERSGATTINELVKNIAALDILDQGELTGNSPSGSGTSNLQIRGLNERNLLVLLNGRRLPVNALQDGSGAGAAVDVNNIPLSAIDRVEVLKDGGSAIYGSDAIAGVINFITRKNYNGVEGRLGYGQSSRNDAKEKAAGLVFGFGDYDQSGFNILGALDVFKRDPILRTARDLTSTADWRRFDGATDGRSGFHPNGNILNAAGTAVVGQVIPCPPDQLKGTTCRFDFNKSILTSSNGADRWSSMLIGNLKLGTTRVFGELVYSESKDVFQAQPAPGNFTDALGRSVNGRFLQVGPRTTNRKASLLSATVGLDGTFGNYDWDVALGRGTNKITNSDTNYLASDLFGAAISAGRIDPTSSTNLETELNKIRLTPQRVGKSDSTFLNGKFSGILAELPGGSLGFAVGGSVFKETLSDQPDINSQNGNVFGSIAQAPVSASRDLKAVFAELSIPILKNLEAQVAVRSDNYSAPTGTLGGVSITGSSASRASPKVAFKFRPMDSVLMRASYAESFLAPSLKQMFGGQDEGAESTSDKVILCPAFGVSAVDCDNFAYQQVNGSNRNLKPETGKTYNFGIVLEPNRTFSFGFDFWRIKKDNEVGVPTVETAVQKGFYSRINNQWKVFVTNQNIAASETQGVDFDFRLRLGDTPIGRLSITDSATYYNSVKRQDEPGDPVKEYAGTFLTPRWRNTLTFNLENGPWSTNATIRSTDGMRDTNQEFGSAAYKAAREINSHEELDVGFQYTGIKGLTIGGNVKNLLDRSPPFSAKGAANQYGSLGFPYMYSPRGRFFQMSANYKFF